ncbi:MAG: type II toxin-antitoxin system VapC family toxin [Acidobacteriaceae bacterium]
MIVLDASAAIEWLLLTPAGLRIEKRIYSGNETLHAPQLIDIEVAQVLRRFEWGKVISETRAAEALDDLLALRITRYPHFSLLKRIWKHRHYLSAYDASYVALAEELNIPLITLDKRLATSGRHAARIEVF